MTRHILTIASLCCVLSTDVAGQAPRGAITGTVLSRDLEPVAIRRVSLTLVSLDNATTVSVINGDDGRFSFDAVPDGRYKLRAFKPGFIELECGARRFDQNGSTLAVTASARSLDVRCFLERGGAVSGTVYGLDGRAAPGFTGVRLLSATAGGNEEVPSRRAGVVIGQTDDRGQYRFYGIPPGDYRVAARLNVPGMPVIEVVNEPGPFHVTAGESHDRIDVFAQAVSAGKIVGQILGAEPGVETTVSVTPGSRQVRVGNDGRFSFEGLRPGPYRIVGRALVRATGRQDVMGWGSTTAFVSGGETTTATVSLSLRPTLTVNGRVVFDGARLPTAEERRFVSVRLVPDSDENGLEQARVAVAADGTFSIAGIVPGRYRLDATIQRSGRPGVQWRVESATIAGRNAIDASVELSEDAPHSDALVRVSNHAQGVEGTLQTPGRDPRSLTLVVFPASLAERKPDSRRVKTTVPERNGMFAFDDLPAGEYLLAAIEDLRQAELADPGFFVQIQNAATPVSVLSGRRSPPVTLRVNPPN